MELLIFFRFKVGYKFVFILYFGLLIKLLVISNVDVLYKDEVMGLFDNVNSLMWGFILLYIGCYSKCEYSRIYD